MRRTAHLPALWALAAAFLALPARADDVGALVEVLEENVVTGASRSAEQASAAPATSSTITAEQLRRFGIHRVDQALNYLSLGMFAHDRMSTVEVGARGMALTRDQNSHVLVVLDGMVMNEQSGGSVFMHDIPLDSLDHIEVILGPGSVLYGAQAMLGVINVVTKDSKDWEGYHASTSFGFSPPLDVNGDIESPDSFGSLGHENHYMLGTGQRFNLLGVPGGLTLHVDYHDFVGPDFAFKKQALPTRAGGGPAIDLGPNAEPGFWGGPVREQWYRRTLGSYSRVDLGDLTWATRATVTRLGMPQQDLFESRAPAAYDDPQNSNEYVLVLSNLRFQRRIADRLMGMARVYFGYSGRHNSRNVVGHDAPPPGVPLGVIDPEQCPTGPTGPCDKQAGFYSRWYGSELQSTFDWMGDGAVTTMAGVDGRLRTSAYEFVTFDQLSGQSYGSDPAFTRWHGGGNDKADEYALGAYLQQNINPWKFLTLNAGVRYDADSRISAKFASDAISPRAAVILSPIDPLSVKLIYATAFRAPSFLEQRIVNGRLLPNPQGLKPETVSSYEASTTLRIEEYTVSVGGFYAMWHDLIELQIIKATAPSVSRYENVGEVRNMGGNLSFEASWLNGKLRTGLNAMVTSTERQLNDAQTARNSRFGQGDTAPITVAPQVYGNARASYMLGKDTSVALAAGYFGRRIADQAYYGGDPSNLIPRPEAPPQLTLRGAFTGSFPGVKGVNYTLGADYAFASKDPYVVGPNQGVPRYLNSTPVDSELARVNRLTAFGGLEFHIN